MTLRGSLFLAQPQRPHLENDTIGADCCLKLGSCSSLEAPGDKWIHRASSLPPRPKQLSGIQNAFQKAAFCRKASAASKRDSESHGTRDGEVLSSPQWHYSLKTSQEGPARSSNPDQDGRKAAGTSRKATNRRRGVLPHGASEFPHSPPPRQTHPPRPFGETVLITSEPPVFLS